MEEVTQPTSHPPARMSPLGLGLNYGRGLLMGAADIVPGVSGGTMALIVGIYERLIRSIRAAAGAPLPLFRGDVASTRARLREVEWALVLPLGAGILTALIAGALTIEPLLEDYPQQTRALFFGLIAASVPLPWRRMSTRGGRAVGVAAAAALVAFLLVGIPPATVEDPALPVVFLAASVAICAMILPGVSGAFLLLVMGIYEATLAAIGDVDIAYIAVFGAGAVVGLGLFSRLLEWLLRNRFDVTMAVLVGLMLGSLRALWPWQDADRGFEAPPLDGSVAVVIALAVLGFAIVTALVRVAERREDPRDAVR
jgi:putative membrane protein